MQASSFKAKALNNSTGVAGVFVEYKRWLAVRKPLVGDTGPAPPGSLKAPSQQYNASASTICPASNTDPTAAEVTPWGITFTQSDDPLLRSILVSSSVLFCVVDSGWYQHSNELCLA